MTTEDQNVQEVQLDEQVESTKGPMSDNQTVPVEGLFSVTKIDKEGNETVLVEEKNLVVNQAATILRDLMFDGVDKISKFQFGDLGLLPTDNTRDVAVPVATAVSLVNKLYEKDAVKSKVVHNLSPAILYTVILEHEEFNGTGSQLITEFSLATEAGLMFSVKNRAGIYKDAESSLRFNWTLVFN